MDKCRGLCYRCEYRARFHETGDTPRFECGTEMSVCNCYMYRPVRPVVTEPARTNGRRDRRPRMIGWMLSAREAPLGIADCRMRFKTTGKRGVTMYWVPK